MQDSEAPLTVFIDGACPLCRREANFFSKRVDPQRLQLVDIAQANFEAKAYGLDPRAVHRQIHGKKPNGEVVTGIDTLAEMWRLLPRTRWLASLTQMPVSRQAMQMGYWVFARLRPHLPGRSCSC